MSNTATISDVVTRNSVQSALKAAPKPDRAHPAFSVRTALWIALMAVSAITIVPIAWTAAVNLETWTLLQADDASVKSKLTNTGKDLASADYLETLAELGVQPATQDLEAARLAAKTAVEVDPSRAHAWSLLAYLDSVKDGKITPAALDALTRSMNACPLCDQDLIRWRFNFVLANWNAVPDELRRRAFEQADILRWIGQNREFLAEMRLKAMGAGIPFDEYRSAVETPFRTLDIGPAPQAAATDLLRPKT
jgi:hypothetical protein